MFLETLRMVISSSARNGLLEISSRLSSVFLDSRLRLVVFKSETSVSCVLYAIRRTSIFRSQLGGFLRSGALVVLCFCESECH
jgi:hypothetical protein